jgi:peptidoglycan/LPS O-acetylase OafA/YrhL
VAPTPSPPVKPGFLSRVESVRGLAALSVALGHTLTYVLVNDGSGGGLLDQTSLRGAAVKIITGLFNGETAVIVFFVISGVVIGRSLDARRDGESAVAGFMPFMIRRVLRLYPAHIVAVIAIIGLAFLFLVGQPPIDFSAFPGSHPATSADAAGWLNGSVFNPLKWQSVVGNLAMASWSMNPVAWSLYVEVCAAPLLPLFHYLSRRSSAWVDVVNLAVLIALSLLNWDHLWSRYLFIFYLGMMVETHGLALAGALERWLGGMRPAAPLLYVVMVLPGTFAAVRSAPVIFVEAFAAFALISLIVRSESRAPLSSLEHPLLRWNGRLSYSFYLWHFFLMTIVVRILYETLSPSIMAGFDIAIFLATAFATVAAALAVSQLSYSYVEVPSMGLGRSLTATWRRLAAALGRDPSPQTVVGSKTETAEKPVS